MCKTGNVSVCLSVCLISTLDSEGQMIVLWQDCQMRKYNGSYIIIIFFFLQFFLDSIKSL